MAGFPRDRDTVCPSWCELPADHVLSSDHYDHAHIRTVAEIGIPKIDGLREPGENPVTVQIQGPVDWDDQEWPAVINVSLSGSDALDDDQDLTAAEARELAAALLKAAELVDGQGESARG